MDFLEENKLLYKNQFGFRYLQLKCSNIYKFYDICFRRMLKMAFIHEYMTLWYIINGNYH